MQRRFLITSAIAVVITAAFLPGSGLGSSRPAERAGRSETRFGLADSSRARSAVGSVSSPFQFVDHPELGGRIAVSADGTTALVSATGVHSERGAVYVYHVADAGSWTTSSTPVATLTSSSSRPGDIFGRGVALSADGTTAFIGAPDHGNGTVYVFHVASEDAWTSTSTPAATLSVNHGTSAGYSVSASADGTTLVVGAPFTNFFAGAAYVFHASAEDAWTSTSVPAATLSNAAESNSDLGVGGVVAMSTDGTTALISDSGSGHSAGSAYIFHVASEDGWATSSSPTAILSNGSDFPGSDLGGSLAISGDGTTAFVAAPGVNYAAGAIDVFNVASEDAWASTSTPTAVLTNASGVRGDGLGGFVRASADGLTVAAGAFGVAKGRGSVDVFHVAGEDAWTTTATPTATLTDSTRVPNDFLGAGLAVSGDGATVFTGAPGVNWETGLADVFHVADASSWLTASAPTATLTNSALPAPVCIVPRLVGLPLPFARFVVSATDCRLGKVKRVHAKAKKGRVVSQSPAAKKHLAPGSKIKLKVSK